MVETVLAAKKRKSNPILLLALLFAGSLAVLLSFNLPHAFVPFLGGLYFGYVIQRSRFCFASSFRDIFLLRNTALTRSLLVALAVTTVGFTLTDLFFDQVLLESAGRVYPLGVHTFVGGLVFGFGMVIAGSCVSGCLVRMGEGYLMQWSTFAGILIGSLLGAWHLNWWLRPEMLSFPAVFLPGALGWPAALVLQFALIGTLFFVAAKIEQTQNPWSIFQAGSVSWAYGTGAVLLALGNVVLLNVWGRPWGITTGLTHFAGWAGKTVGVPVEGWSFFASTLEGTLLFGFLQHPLLYLSIAMVVGGFIAAVRHHEFRLRRPRTAKYSYSAVAGGVLMGYGSRLAFGCNIGALLSGIGSLSLHGWVFCLAVVFGAALGGKVLLRLMIL